MSSKTLAFAAVDEIFDKLVALSHSIHSHAEIAFQEAKSAQLIRSFLEQHGFVVDREISALPTAFRASFGSGSLNVGICAEYDALPGIGHACGHNIIGSAAVGAAIALSKVADQLDLTVTVLGTPAEEGGGGKIRMLQAGAFDGLNLAMMIHPYAEERDAMGSLAVSQYDVTFNGKPAHAAAHPEDGISASAALALAQTGIAFLREHLLETDRVHGIVTFGGEAPNIVPGRTEGRWFIRATDQGRLKELEPKVIDVFKGAALMTGCAVEIRKMAPSYTEIRSDQVLTSLWRDAAADLGRRSKPLQPTDAKASTDMGNVSYAMPTIHPLVAIESNGANIHQAAFAKAAISVSGDAAIAYGSKAMAATAIALAQGPDRERFSKVFKVADEQNRSYLDEGWAETITFDH